jgi:hypothetical protein
VDENECPAFAHSSRTKDDLVLFGVFIEQNDIEYFRSAEGWEESYFLDCLMAKRFSILKPSLTKYRVRILSPT